VSWKRVWILLLLSVLLPGRATFALPVSIDLGFFIALYETLDGVHRATALGPLYESRTTPAGDRFQAYRPFYNRVEIPDQKLVQQELLWPLATTRVRDGKATWRFLSVYGWNDDINDPKARARVWGIPFYFQGRTREGETCFGLFPIYGAMQDFFGRDDMTWVLFPLYSSHGVNDVRTVNILWPIFSRTQGGDVDRLRVFPFYGHSTLEGKMEKRFILWPFWTDVKYDYPGASGGGFVFFPFYGHVKLEDQETTWILPPFFRFSKGNGNTKVFGPWPFFQSSTGKVEKQYYFPLLGEKNTGNVTSQFFLWPIASRETVYHEDHVIDRAQIMPFWYQITWTPTVEGGLDRRYFKFWPILRYERDGEQVKFNVPALWPLRDTGPVERNFAPFWRLINYSEKGDEIESDMFWGLIRHQQRGDASYRSIFPFWESSEATDPEKKSWRILKGLVGHKRTNDTNHWQLLYLLKW
jgi:hypothetical protein